MYCMSAGTVIGLLQQGIQQQMAGRLQDAEFTLRRALLVAPSNPDALHALGMVTLQRGRPEEALGLIDKAIAGKPKIGIYHANRSNALTAFGRRDEAAQSWAVAARRQPDLPDVHNGLGLALRSAARLAEAEASLREAVRRVPQDASVLGNLASVLIERGMPDAAEPVLRRTIQLAPGSPNTRTISASP